MSNVQPDESGTTSTPPTSGETSNSGNTGTTNGNKNNNNNKRNTDKRNIFNSNERTWQGEKPEVGAVLGLRAEWLDKKVSHRVFMEKMVDFVLREFRNANDVISLVRDQVDPRTDFEANHMPADLTDIEKKSDVRKAIQQQRIKLFVNREMELENNIHKIYGIVKGQ